MSILGMPGSDEKHPRCPKGERRDKKTKKCVKAEKAKTPSPKRNTVKASSPKKSSPKSTRKSPFPKTNVKAPSPKKSPPKANIPYLSTMKDLSTYTKRYMDSILVAMANIIAGKSPMGTSTYYYVNLYTLNRFLQQEINEIQTKEKSRGYVFTSADIKYIVPQLQRLKTYFKQIANKKGHVDTDEIIKLYRN